MPARKRNNIQKISIISMNGDDYLGCIDWDDILYNILLDRYCQAVGMDPGDIDKVLLVGGCTNMPIVKNAVEARFPGIVKVEDPERAVAKGAAVYASYGSDSDKGIVIKVPNFV